MSVVKNLRNSETKKKHIDDVQTQTVDEHFKLILEDKSTYDPDSPDVTFNDLPDWYNDKLYKKGQSFYMQNFLSMVVANTVGLIVVLSVPEILKVLQYTKRSSTPHAAFKRYIETLLHMYNLATNDPQDTNSKWYKSMNAIRWYHKMATRRTKNSGIGEISQRDMVLTQFAFVGYALVSPTYFGLRSTPEEEEAFNHLWRVNGYMLGIPDRFNLCRKDAKETIQLCEKIKGLYVNYLTNIPSEFNDVMRNAIDALWYFDITINTDAVLYFTYLLHGIKYKELGWYSWLNLKYRELIIKLYYVPYIGTILRICYNYLIHFLIWNVQHFPILAWIKFGKQNVRLNLYPKH
ncbi:uncharacterized protein LOC105423913 [Pogonomyrmex barbatus]|uniref:Uncharacterized protein LOC105423913 n=1 Tax=Pogonomyrmex barbatus TaxID=144034 RepID=A0A6I9WKA8_9HYME|nr:uncharacterized protein LOC105423913 [Pogonomyrmex barbatus]